MISIKTYSRRIKIFDQLLFWSFCKNNYNNKIFFIKSNAWRHLRTSLSPSVENCHFEPETSEHKTSEARQEEVWRQFGLFMPLHACYLSADWRKKGKRARTWYFHPFLPFPSRVEKSFGGGWCVLMYTRIDFSRPRRKAIRSCSLIPRTDCKYSRTVNVLVAQRQPVEMVHGRSAMMKKLCENHWFFRSHSFAPSTSTRKYSQLKAKPAMSAHEVSSSSTFSSISSRLPFSISQTFDKKLQKRKPRVIFGESESDGAFNRYWMSVEREKKCFQSETY